MNPVDMLKALGDETRLRIINLLMENELCVCELETILLVSQPNISRHLQKLKQSGLITSKRDGQWIHYLIDPGISKDTKALLESLIVLLEEFGVLYQRDRERFSAYNKYGYNCRHLTEKKETVLENLKKAVQHEEMKWQELL